MFFRQFRTKGFTLIELLVVVAIISLLSSVVFASLNSAREKARDARRKVDLKQIQTALELYYNECGSYIVRDNCTGAAYGSGGVGWFAYPYVANRSVAHGLVNTGVAGGMIVDPSGVTTTNNIDSSGYMIYISGDYYTLWANLKNPTTTDIATQNNCSLSNYDNYSSSVPVVARMNYCISN
ncbi:MAG: type II secretion system protein [Minisyncoccia bacterium]